MFTYEQLAPFLHRWAFHYQSRKYDHWELIDSAWLSPRIQKLKELRYASISIKRAMIEYMRDEEKWRVRTKQRPKFITLPDDLSQLKVENKGKIDDYQIETVDFFDWLTKRFSKRSKQLIKRLYFDGYLQVECAKEFKVSQQRISQLHKSLLGRTKEKLAKNM